MRTRSKQRSKSRLKKYSIGLFSVVFAICLAVGAGSLAFGTAQPDTFAQEPTDIAQVSADSQNAESTDSASEQAEQGSEDAAVTPSEEEAVNTDDETQKAADEASADSDDSAKSADAQAAEEEAASAAKRAPAKDSTEDDEAVEESKPDPVDPGTIASPTWDISKSKTAKNLNDDMTSEVTLSLPSGEEQLATDVVFVLDKSTSAEVENSALAMLKDLQTQVQNTHAKVNVGIVIFNREAHQSGFYDLATQYSEIEAAVKQEIHSGTNTHAGLIAGEAMLDGDKTVDASRKYLIFASDGITYMYNSTPTATAWGFDADGARYFAGPDNWASKYGSNAAPADWQSWLGEVGGMVQSQGTTYEYPYGSTITDDQQKTNWKQSSNYASSVDVALYKTYKEYQSIASKYHAYALAAGTGSGAQYTWGPSFMNYLAGGETVSFDQIKNDISYLVDAGSYVDDYMGYVDGDYDFDFVNDASALSLKVGDETLTAEQTGENAYGFGKNADGSYKYELEYTPGDKKAEEHFRLSINVPVSNFAPVQLTYSVKLTNPKTEAGTYGKYDEDGSQNFAGLYTNNSAALYPTTTDGTKLDPEAFGKPTVSYTVKDEPKNPDNPTPPNTDEPKDNPPTPTSDKPASDQPAEEAAAPAPDTGDNLPWALPLAALACAAGVLVVARKRRNN